MSAGAVVSVNVGAVREVRHGERMITTAIWKHPVDGAVPIRGVNLRGDDQADRSVHGGPDKAVYAYASEDADWWERELGRPLGPAPFGENLATRGIDVNGARIGDRWEVGSALLEVCQPRIPCFKLGLRHDDPLMPRRFAKARRPGAYLRIVQEGAVAAGDRVAVVHRPGHDVTVALVNEVYLGDRGRAGELLAAPELADSWRAWAAERASA
jgi:MOSC domain-containing protein YiiM